MKTPKKRRMGIYIIWEIFENLGSQMGIYIYIYHTQFLGPRKNPGYCKDFDKKITCLKKHFFKSV